MGHAEQHLHRMSRREGCAFNLSQQQASVALSAVDRPKERIDVAFRCGVVLESKRVPFNSFQVFFALEDE